MDEGVQIFHCNFSTLYAVTFAMANLCYSKRKPVIQCQGGRVW